MLPPMKRLRPPDPRDGPYSIDPQLAIVMLDGGAPNRPLNDRRAQRFAAAAAAGTWRCNGETIVFDEKDRLMDGQTRLRAIVLANKPIETYCIFGVPYKFFPTFDQGAMRNGGDLAATIKFQNYNTVASVARMAIFYADGVIGKTGQMPLAAERLRLFLDRHRDDLDAAVVAALRHRKGIWKLIPISHAAFAFYMTAGANRDRAQEFLEKLSTGVGLQKGDGLLLFRARMQDLIGHKHKLLQVDKLALLIKTWNAFIGKRPMGTLKWNREVETFPRFEEAEKQ